MDLEKIKAILDNNDLSKKDKEYYILRVVGEDEEAIPTILGILGVERKKNKELILDSNLELSRALITLEDPKVGKKKPIIELSFVTGEIRKHYLKWKDTIRTTLKIEGLP